MAGLGSPLAFTLGGSPSVQARVYDSLRQNVGSGIRADWETIVEKWRWARARGLAATQLDEKAAAQAFPDLSTDYLPIWEELLDLAPDPDLSETERQARVLNEYTRAIDASYPKLETSLQDLDALMSILLIPHDFARITVPGRAFEDWDPLAANASGPAFRLGAASGGAGDNATAFPNFADEFILNVLFNVGAGALAVSNQLTITEATDLLNDSLPAWVGFRLFTACGFILDQDLLDVTAMCDGVVLP